MSFKREGNDPSQLNVLKKRRVADLLAHFIPEDEAALLKNGSYACLVCTYRPVFDTVDMLTVHRKGRRHLEGMKWFYGKKTRVKNEVAKRRHANYVQEEDGGQAERQGSGSDPADTPAPPGSALEASERTAGSKQTQKVNTASSSYTAVQVDDSKPTRSKKEYKARVSEPVTAQRRRELEHYLQLKSDGWLQDRSGQWVKDENAEFDSDEDEPPPLAPLPPGDERD
ncbi:Sodium channel modifier 1 [Merluccius polli]|uniref:Sodium channel modifier 1 n=1 Tax=Merluccius polli TaxID=89951 RepID=A0AA47N621_MERPO|nr:Sodium channel modifier 1 [Merluccius polli]